MAKKNQQEALPANARKFGGELGKFDPINPGEEIKGIFMNASKTTITDRRTKAPKEIMVYKLRDLQSSDRVYKVAGATMLDRAWEDVVDEYGNSDHETTIKTLRGKTMSIVRGQDGETFEGNRLGSYEIIIWD